jgi:hypothetical protein
VRILAGLTRRLEARADRHRPSGPAPRRPRVGLVGTPAAALGGGDAAGAARDIVWRPGARHLVAFLTSSCAPCQALWPGLSERGISEPGLSDGGLAIGGARLVIVTPDPSMESRRRIAELAPAGADVVMSSRAWFDYGVAEAPWFALVVDGVIEAEGHARTWVDVEVLAGEARPDVR